MNAAAVRRMPPGWRAEDFMADAPPQGFLPLSEAARQMGMTEADVLNLVAPGVLEAREDGLYLYVRPAIVSIVGVKDKR